MKKFVLLLFIASVFTFVACQKSQEFVAISMTAEDVAVKGYDVVSYFVESGAVKGNPQFEFVWNGAKWLFSSAENMEKFKANPEKYAPQFGGYCSWAVSQGYTADGDPNAWKIVDGKLYLNYNQQVKEKWEAKQNELIKDGEKNWTEFKSKPPQKKG